MATLYVVRHGQARLFTEDYDRLSDLGRAQANALAQHWLQSGVRIDTAWTGKLKRQIDTASAVEAAFRDAGENFPVVARDARFDEYPAETIMQTLGRHLCETESDLGALAARLEAATDERARYRDFHQLLEAVIARWVEGHYASAVDLPVSWREWSEGVRSGLRRVMSRAGKGGAAAIFTSGGVVGVTVQTVMQAPDIKAAELNWRVHNASVTRYTFSGDRVSLDAFNDVSHLSARQLTYR
jgi:broad specificity phosphatase PhoE